MPMGLTVVVFKRPNMFEVHDSYFNMSGYLDLKGLFTNPKFYPLTKSLTLYYPERFLNLLEQRELTARLEAKGYEKVLIVTHSVYILQTVKSSDIRVVNDKPIVDNQGLFKLSNDDVGLPLNLEQLQLGGFECVEVDF